MFKRFLLLTAASLVLLSLPALGQVRQVTIDSETMTVRDLLKEVERQSGLSFAYDNADVDLSAEVKAKAHKEDVLSFLNRVLASRNLEAQLDGSRLFLKKIPAKTEQASGPQRPKTLTGIVKDATGAPLIGATV